MLNISKIAVFSILLILPQAAFPIFNIKYPFKPVDLLIFCYSMFFLLFCKEARRFTRPVIWGIIFLLYSVFSVVWGAIYLSENAVLIVMEGEQQVSYYSVAVRKIFLIFVCVMCVWFTTSIRRLTLYDLFKYWYYGLCIAFFFHLLSYILLDDLLLIRGGTFLEGNHGGSYYLLSFFLMWHASSSGFRFASVGMFVSFFAVILSQSSASFILFLTLALIYLMIDIRRFGVLRLSAYLFTFVIAFLLLVGFFGDDVYSKLFDQEINKFSYSRYDRLSSIMSAFEMFGSSPLLGVGLQGYAYALQNHVDPFLEMIYHWNYRRIPNNIYAEVLCEMGVVGLFIFIMFLISVVRPVFMNLRTSPILVLAFLSIIGSWLAFPTFTVSFHWAGLAVIYRALLVSRGDGVY